jgi:succinoglycan biosynthesis transport protein ExoP
VNSAGDAFADQPATLAEYLAILRRRKWIVITLPVLAALVAYLVSTQQSPSYKATAQVWFDLSNAATAITGTETPAGIDPNRYLTTQGRIARSPMLADRVADAASVPGTTPNWFQGQASASPQTDADVLDLSVSAPNAGYAVSLANTYAKQFTRFKAQLDRAAIADALRSIEKQIKKLSAQGANDTPRYDALVQKKLDLDTEGELVANNARVLQPANGATQIQPRPKRNAILGGLLGLVLAIGLAFLAEALDKRVRTEREIEQALGIPLLGRIPRPSRRLRKANKLVMLAEPTSVHAQTFRRLRTSLEFVNFEQGARMIMVTSALPREGKSTTVANLAVTLARAGRRIAIADLDLRRPFLHYFFGTGNHHGFTDVVVDRVKLDRAVRPVALPGASHVATAESPNGRPSMVRGNASNGRTGVECVLNVLPAGSIPPAADEFLEGERVSTVLQDLSERFDLVLIDAPPLLAVGDVMTLSTKVDAIVVVTRLGIHRRQLEELARQLQKCRAPLLGFVLTGASHGDSYSYGYGYDQRVFEASEEAERPGELA